jgi:hypothetical protein
VALSEDPPREYWSAVFGDMSGEDVVRTAARQRKDLLVFILESAHDAATMFTEDGQKEERETFEIEAAQAILCELAPLPQAMLPPAVFPRWWLDNA